MDSTASDDSGLCYKRLRHRMDLTDDSALCRVGIQIRDFPQANPMAVIRDMSDTILRDTLSDEDAAELRRVAPLAPSICIYTFQGFTSDVPRVSGSSYITQLAKRACPN